MNSHNNALNNTRKITICISISPYEINSEQPQLKRRNYESWMKTKFHTYLIWKNENKQCACTLLFFPLLEKFRKDQAYFYFLTTHLPCPSSIFSSSSE